MENDIYEPVQPPASLRRYVRRFMVADCSDPVNFSVPVRATGYGYLGKFFRGAGQAIVNGEVGYDAQESPLHFSGQVRDATIFLNYDGLIGHVLAEFSALGFYELMGVTGEACLDRATSPFSVRQELMRPLGPLVREVAPDDTSEIWQARMIEALETCALDPFPVPDFLTDGVAQIEAANGTLKLTPMCKELGVSPRHFTREFNRIVGIPPKVFSRVQQVNRALQAMLEDDAEYLADIALNAGFSDQAHFNRVFRGFLMASPREFLHGDDRMLFTFLGKSRQI